MQNLGQTCYCHQAGVPHDAGRRLGVREISNTESCEVSRNGEPDTNSCEVSRTYEETREEINARIRDTITKVDRRMDSDDWVPWSLTSDEAMAEIKIKTKADPDDMRPETAANERRHNERFFAELDKTTAHS